MKVRFWMTVALLVALCQMSGCGNSDTAPPAAPSVAETGAPGPAAGEDRVEEVPLQIAGWDEVQKLVQNARGKVVVVDVWSSWCVPCIREFPKLVELHRKYSERVEVISVNVNYTGGESAPPESFRESVETFLRKQGATFTNVISSDADFELYKKLELAAVPVVLVYDRQGQLAQRFDNDEDEYGAEGFTYAQHIEPLVSSLLEENGQGGSEP